MVEALFLVTAVFGLALLFCAAFTDDEVLIFTDPDTDTFTDDFRAVGALFLAPLVATDFLDAVDFLGLATVRPITFHHTPLRFANSRNLVSPALAFHWLFCETSDTCISESLRNVKA